MQPSSIHPKQEALVEEKSSTKFKQLCQARLKKQPIQALVNCLRPNNALHIEIDALTNEDSEFFEVLFCMPLTQMHFEGSHNKSSSKRERSSSKKPPTNNPGLQIQSLQQLKHILKIVNKAVEHSSKLKSLILQHLNLTERLVYELKSGIENSRSLKELVIRKCGITEKHLEPLIPALISNKTLMSIDFSGNKIVNIHEVVGKVLSEHNTRRNQQLWLYGLRNELPQEDISTFGICEVNLDSNLIDDKSVTEFMKFFRNDSWTRVLSLKSNLLGKSSIQDFALLLKRNTSLISLDLRENPGFDKQLGKPIFRRLVKNLEQFKKYKQNYGKKQKQEGQTADRSASRQKKRTSIHHNSYVLEKQTKAHTAHASRFAPLMNITQQQFQSQPQQQENKCENCRLSQIRLLQIEKRNLDLMLENNRLKKLFFPKNNVDLSNINPPLESVSGNLRQLQATFHLNNVNQISEDNLMQKMEHLMLDLTKILENIQHHTQTQILNPLSNTTHNNSNTVHILAGNNQHSFLEQRREQEESATIDHQP